MRLGWVNDHSYYTNSTDVCVWPSLILARRPPPPFRELRLSVSGETPLSSPIPPRAKSDGVSRRFPMIKEADSKANPEKSWGK
jgi:hypothetical protein